MNRIFYSAVSGLLSSQNRMNVTANNLSNENTVGYQAQRADFSDLIYTNLPGKEKDTQLGNGTKLESVTTMQTNNGMKETGEILDAAVEGKGYFCIRDKKGNTYYTKDGNFKLQSSGKDKYLVTANGDNVLDQSLKPIQIKNDGDIKLTGPSSKSSEKDGKIHLAVYQFDNPCGLLRNGENRMSATPASGEGKLDVTANVRQGALSSSNVDIAEEMSNLIQSQRGFQLGAQVLRTADELEQMANSLRG